MPDRKLARRPTLWRLILFNLLGGVLALLGAGQSRGSGRPTEPIWPKPIEPDTADDPTTAFTDHRRRRSRRRFATSLAFATLFFAGAAFSAGAGDVVVDLLESDEPAVEQTSVEEEQPAVEEDTAPAESTDTAEPLPGGDEGSSEEPVNSETEGAEPGAELDPNADPGTETNGEAEGESNAESSDESMEEPPAAEPGGAESEISEAPVGETGSEDGAQTVDQPEPTDGVAEEIAEAQEDTAEPTAPADSENDGATSEVEETAAAEDTAEGSEEVIETTVAGEKSAVVEDEAPPVVEPKAESVDAGEPEPEIESIYATATVWLHRELPDPTPPARRLKWAFGKELLSVASDSKVDWALILAVLRAEGHHGSTPATRAELEKIATSLVKLGAHKDEWAALLAYSGRTSFADQAEALARYNRAVGLRSLIGGLDASKEDLADKVLDDDRIQIYGGGRADIKADRIDVRVLVLLLYLAEAHDQVTVSSLFAGHRLYARPGVISAHIYGLAVDIAALNGQSILGNSQPGGITEEAVRNILLLPAELQPQQVISLLGLGGPSFPLDDHADHIHIGF